MLKYFSRLEKTRNFILLLFALIMVASLVLFYAPTRGDNILNLTASNETAARVAGEYITVGEIARQKESFSRASQGQQYPTKSILEGLIGSRIVRVEAARLGLRASDAEVAALIRETFKPEDGKPFDQKRYEQSVIQQYGSVSAFEESIRDRISAEKLRFFVTSGVSVSEEEVLNNFQRRNTRFDLSYVLLSPSEFAKNITPGEEELREYFEKNKAAYHIDLPQKKIRYVFLNTSKVGEKAPIPEEDLKAEYDKLPDDKKIAGVLGRELVLRVAKPEFDGQVFEKATSLVQQLRKDGTTVSEEAFAELARGQSENAASAPSGGNLPGPVRENLNNQEDPYQRLIKMKPGEITDPINYKGRYFILWRGEAVPKSFEDARRELEVSLRNRRAYAAAAELAKKGAELLRENKSVEKTAELLADEANMKTAEMIRETGFVKPGDDVEKVGVSPQFEAGIASLENPQDTGDPIPVQEGFAIPLLVEKREPRDAEFEEVRDKIIDAVKLEKAAGQIANAADQIAAGADSAAELAAAAGSQNTKALEVKSYIIGSPLGEGPAAANSTELEDAIFALKEGEVTKKPIKIGENYYVVGVTKREDANMEEFAKQRDSLTEQMLNQKRGEIFGDYLAETRQRMETAGEIVIYQEAIDKIDAAAEALPSALPPGFPGGLPGGVPGS